jgi:dolichol-phosphate mannosyltransferase
MSPVVYFLMLVAFIYGIRKIKDDRWRFIFVLPAPALALFYYQPLMSAYKPHWSGPAYMILLFGAVKIFLDGIPGFIPAKSKWIASFALVFMVPFQLLYITLLTPVIPKIFAATAAPDQKWTPSWDFTNEFYGWPELGAHLKEVRDEITAKTGQTPLFAAQRYELIAQLTWGTQEKVWQLCRDRDQYLYEQSDADRLALVGRDFLIVNNDKYPQDPREVAHFESCDKLEWPFYRGEILARTFYIYHCKNFQGLN